MGTVEANATEANTTDSEQIKHDNVSASVNESMPVNGTEKHYKKEIKKKTVKESIHSDLKSMVSSVRSQEIVKASQEKLKTLDEMYVCVPIVCL